MYLLWLGKADTLPSSVTLLIVVLNLKCLSIFWSFAYRFHACPAMNFIPRLHSRLCNISASQLAVVISLNGKRLHPFFVQKLKLSLCLDRFHARASEDFSYFLQSSVFRLISDSSTPESELFYTFSSSSSSFWISTSTYSGFSFSNSFWLTDLIRGFFFF